MNCHEAIDIMGEALTDELPPPLLAGFREHMDECGSCRTYFDQLRVTRQTLRALPSPSPEPDRVRDLIRRYRETLGGERRN